jgi:TRAP-type C4-dicarboxylate transport system substrate-binding protein
MSADAHDDIPDGDKAIVLEAAKAGARASRTYAAGAEASGVAVLKRGGMQVQDSIDRQAFIAAMAPANPEFETLFGRQRIDEVRNAA